MGPILGEPPAVRRRRLARLLQEGPHDESERGLLRRANERGAECRHDEGSVARPGPIEPRVAGPADQWPRPHAGGVHGRIERRLMDDDEDIGEQHELGHGLLHRALGGRRPGRVRVHGDGAREPELLRRPETGVGRASDGRLLQPRREGATHAAPTALPVRVPQPGPGGGRRALPPVHIRAALHLDAVRHRAGVRPGGPRLRAHLRARGQ